MKMSLYLLSAILFQAVVLSSPVMEHAMTLVDLMEQKLVTKFILQCSESLNTTSVFRSSMRNSSIYESSRFVQQQYTPVISQWLRRDVHSDSYTYDRDLFGHAKIDIINQRSNHTNLIVLKDLQKWKEPKYMQIQLSCQGRKNSVDLHLFVGGDEADIYANNFAEKGLTKYVASLQFSNSGSMYNIYKYKIFSFDSNHRRILVYSDYNEFSSILELNHIYEDTTGNMYGTVVKMMNANLFIASLIHDYLNGSVCRSEYRDCRGSSTVIINMVMKVWKVDCSPLLNVHLFNFDKLAMLLPLPDTYFGTYSQYTAVIPPPLWLLIGITYIILFVFLKFVFKVNLSFIEMSFEFIIRPIFQNALNVSQYVGSGRGKSLLMLSMILTILLVNGFTSVMTSLMIVPVENMQPDTLEKLADSTEYKISFVQKTSVVKALLRTARVDNATAFKVLNNSRFGIGNAFLRPIIRDKTAIIYTFLYLKERMTYELIDKEGRPLGRLYPLMAGAMLQGTCSTFESTFREKLASYITRSTAGHIKEQFDSAYNELLKLQVILAEQKEMFENNERPKRVKPLTLNILAPCFVIFGCLLGLCFVCFVSELFTQFIT